MAHAWPASASHVPKFDVIRWPFAEFAAEHIIAVAGG